MGENWGRTAGRCLMLLGHGVQMPMINRQSSGPLQLGVGSSTMGSPVGSLAGTPVGTPTYASGSPAFGRAGDSSPEAVRSSPHAEHVPSHNPLPYAQVPGFSSGRTPDSRSLAWQAYLANLARQNSVVFVVQLCSCLHATCNSQLCRGACSTHSGNPRGITRLP